MTIFGRTNLSPSIQTFQPPPPASRHPSQFFSDQSFFYDSSMSPAELKECMNYAEILRCRVSAELLRNRVSAQDFRGGVLEAAATKGDLENVR